MKYIKKVVGEKCYLSHMLVDDTEQFTAWLNDLDVTVTMAIADQIITAENEKEFLLDINKKGEYIFSIVDLKTDKLIGSCGLHGVNDRHHNAIFGICIGNKKYWNKGYGTEATKLILDYGFNILNLNNIALTVYSFNKKAVKCYEKCGFKLIGRRRKERLIGGQYHDVIWMDILAEEFKDSRIIKKIQQISK